MEAELFHAGGRTDGKINMTEPIFAFRNFANAPIKINNHIVIAKVNNNHNNNTYGQILAIKPSQISVRLHRATMRARVQHTNT